MACLQSAAAYFEAHPSLQLQIEAALSETVRRRPADPLAFMVRPRPARCLASPPCVPACKPARGCLLLAAAVHRI